MTSKANSAELWCCPSTLRPKWGDVKHQRQISKSTLVSIIDVFKQGMPSKRFLHNFFVCLKSSWNVVDALRSEKDAKSDNKLFASPLKNLQLLLNSLISMFQPEFKIVIFLNKSVTICNFADSLSQTGNRLNKLHVDSLLISASHQNLLLGCANLTRKLYLLSRNTW